MPRAHSLGVLFVHGIGLQRRGSTLIRYGQPVVDAVRDRFSKGAPPATVRPGQPGAPEFGKAFLDNPDAPPHVEVKFRNVASKPGAKADSDWLFAEAWWADIAPVPPFSELFRWSVDIVPWTVLAHFDTRMRRAWFRLLQGATREGVIFAALGAILKLIILIVVSLVAIQVLLVLLLAILVIAALPIPYARDAAAWLQRLLAQTIGDSYAFVGWSVARAAIVGRVARDFTWLQQRCERVVIVAHSQGAAITHEFLRNAPLTPCDAFVTIGSGVRKLSEIQEAVDSDGQKWLRCVVGAGVFCDIVLVILFNAPLSSWWQWVLRCIVEITVAGALLAFFKWQEVSSRSLVMDQQLINDQEIFDRRYRLLKRIPWTDFFSNADPVPNGALLDSLNPKSMLARAFDNYHSMLFDHTTYLQNRDDFVAQLSRVLMIRARIAFNGIDPKDDTRQNVASARRQFRVGSLRVGRWVVFLATVVAMCSWWNDAPGPIDDAVSVVAAGLEYIPLLSDTIVQDQNTGPRLEGTDIGYEGLGHERTGLGNLPGVVLITIAAALWSLLLWLMWAWWNRNDTRRRYAQDEFPFIDGGATGFIMLLMAGLGSAIWAWLTGDARLPLGATVVIAVLCAIVAVTAMLGITGMLATLRAIYADGPLKDAAKRLDDIEQLHLERGVRQRRGWAAFKLGMLHWEDKEHALAIKYLEQALGLGYTHAAVHLGQLLEEYDLRYAIEYYEIGIKKRHPYCAWFKGMLQEKLGEFHEAEKTFRLGLLNLRSPPCGSSLGRLRIRNGDKKGAINAYRIGIKLGDALSAFDLGEIQRQDADAMPPPPFGERRTLLLQSAVNFRKALNWGEISASVHLGDVLLEIDDIVGAREAYTFGMELRYLPAGFKLGELAIQEHDPELAQQAFERCVELAEDQADETLAAQAHYELARLFETMGRQAAAKRSYRRALASETGLAVAPVPLPAAAPVQAAVAQTTSVEEHSGRFMGASLLRLGKLLERPVGFTRRRKVDDAPKPTPGSA